MLHTSSSKSIHYYDILKFNVKVSTAIDMYVVPILDSTT